MRWVTLVLCIGLSACSADLRLGSAAFGHPPSLVIPPDERVVETPDGTVVATPDKPSIEVVVQGLSQAAAVRSYLRQLR